MAEKRPTFAFWLGGAGIVVFQYNIGRPRRNCPALFTNVPSYGGIRAQYGSLLLPHLPMAQLQNDMIELASLFMGSVNHGILSHTVAIVVVIGFSLSAIVSRFKPGAMVKTLSKTVEETYIRYNEHKDMLNESAGFEDKINRLRVEAFKLQERHLRAYDEVSLTDLRSWRHRVRETKDIWVEARQRQQEIIELKKELKLAIVKARRNELEAGLGHHGQGGGETTGGEELDGSSVV
ncbi:hypothetical protein EDD18DRAFT_1106978 [Armillaria luteobubalina]|uniref:Uncharacterized protein n=1 Tax=Armillaria luteobubalina TaxID=153913 RepID=A0AA39Q1C6_9AGAR|nr:hypothetical protein EDD18DRAFT_1106978 [Armillaria luteobubalina]